MNVTKRYRLFVLLLTSLFVMSVQGTFAMEQHEDSVLRVLPADTAMVLLPVDTALTALPATLDKTVPLTPDSAITEYADSLQKTVGDTLDLSRFENWQPDPIRAMWLAMVFPGGGQIYNRKYWKLPIIYGGVVGCMYALTWNAQMLTDYSQAYQDIMDSDPTTNSHLEMLPLGYDITGREDHFKSVFKRKKDFYRRFRDISIFCIAGVYLLSIIDAYVDAELSSFDISRDLSLTVSPRMIHSDSMRSLNPNGASPGVSFQLNY